MNIFATWLCRRARWGVAAALSAFVITTPAWAVDDLSLFEVDGNATTGNDTPSGDDWQNVVGTGGNGGSSLTRVFVPDEVPPLAIERVFTGGGSKDDLDLGQWKHKADTDTTPSKDNITNAYAAAYAWNHDNNPATQPHLVIYFGADRFAQNGDANMSFWFFKNPVVPNNATGKFEDGSGNPAAHSIGDVSVQVDFLNGGATTRVRVFEWVGSGGSHGTLNLLVSATSSGAAVCTSGDTACAVTNLTNNIQAYWTYVPKFAPVAENGITGPNVIPPQGFFEGGIDMTALGLSGCFSSYMANTRSSQQVDAVLKDFALGAFSTCGIKVGKSCIRDDTSPKVNPDGRTVHSKYSVPIENFGFGSVFDVTLRENIAYDDPGFTRSCKITAIGGATADIALPGGTPGDAVPIVNELAANTTVAVTVECDASDNPLVNKVIAEAKSNSTLSAPDLDDDHTTNNDDTKPPVETCPVNVTPDIAVTKCCRSVTLVGAQPKVCVDITVTNTGKEDLFGVSVTDNKLEGSPLMTNGALDSNGGFVSFLNQCYTPSAADGNDPNPGTATFTDRVDVSGRGFISKELKSAFATATCPLCNGKTCNP